METAKLYTNRSNARRAGVAAGLPSPLVGITVHKSPQGLRFGWAAQVAPSAPMTVSLMTTEKAIFKPVPKARVEQNGVKRPASGGLCADVWTWLDAHPGATIKELRGVAPDYGWNINNAACEFYTWRKFNGLSGGARR